MTSSTKVKLKIENSYNKTVIDFNIGRHEDLSTLKSGLGELSHFRVDKSFCLPH